MSARAGLATALVALAACGPSTSKTTIPELVPPATDAQPLPAVCSTQTPPKPRASIGPDVSVRALCGQSARAPIASVNAEGEGLVSWSVSVHGDPAFQAVAISLTACERDGPSVAFVTFQAPPDAVPGDKFDAVATVHANDGSFADGTVKLHGEVVVATATVTPSNIDFGDVAQGVAVSSSVTLTVPAGPSISLYPLKELWDPRFSLLQVAEPPPSKSIPVSFTYEVGFLSDTPGDYTASLVWTAQPGNEPAPPQACLWQTTMMVHARVPGDGGADDGGATDAPSDGP